MSSVGSWSRTPFYLAGNKAKYNNIIYTALRTNKGKQPDLFPLDWSPPTLAEVLTGGGGAGATLDYQDLANRIFNQNIVYDSNTTMPFKSLLASAFTRISGVGSDLSGAVLRLDTAESSLSAAVARLDIADVSLGALAGVDAALQAQDLLHDLQIATVSGDLIANSLADVVARSDISGLVERVAVAEQGILDVSASLASGLAGVDLAGLAGVVSTLSGAVDAAVVRIADISGAVETKVGAAEYSSFQSALEASIALKAAAADLSGAILRLDVVDVSMAAYDISLSALGGVDAALQAQDLLHDLQIATAAADLTANSLADALVRVDVSGLAVRMDGVEAALPAKADVSALDAAVLDLSGAIAAKAPKLVVGDATDYASILALGSNALARVGANITLDAAAAEGTVLRVFATADLTFGELDMVAGEVYSARKGASAWEYIPGALSFF